MTSFTAHDSSNGRILYQGWTPTPPKHMSEEQELEAKAQLFKEWSAIVCDRIEFRMTTRAGWREDGDESVLTTTLYLVRQLDEIRLAHRERDGSALIAYWHEDYKVGGSWQFVPAWRLHAVDFADFCTRSSKGSTYQAHRTGGEQQ